MKFFSIKKTKTRLQLDPIECGAVCLGIILESFGKNINNFELRDAVGVSRNGSDAASIIKASEKYGLTANAMRVLASDLRLKEGTAILFFDSCHFVVFEGYFLGRYYINDPASGRYSLDAREFRKRYSKTSIFFSKTSNFEPDSVKKRAYDFDAVSRALLIFLGIFSALFFLSFASLVGLILSGEHQRFFEYRLFLFLGLLLLIGLVVFCLIMYFKIILRASITQCRNEIIRLKHGLARISPGFFDDFPFLVYKSVFISAIKHALLSKTQAANRYFFLPLSLVLIFVISLISYKAALLALLVVFIFFMQSYFKVGLVSSEDSLFKKELDDRALGNALACGFDMRAMGQEDLLVKSLLERELNAHLPKAFLSQSIFTILSPWIPIAFFLFCFCYLSAHDFRKGVLGFREIISVMLYALGLFSLPFLLRKKPVQNTFAGFANELAYAEDRKIEKKRSVFSNELLSLTNVSFSYRGEKKAIWNDISLEIKCGEMVGLVGGPLTGVSTLLRLIAGHLLPTKGGIIHFIKNDVSLRIAFINEDAELFEGTLKDNVTLFDQNIVDEDIVSALKKATATDLFYNRPLGLLTPIVSRGKNLSAGERKRLLLAQALVRKPDLILLDDFLETLDEATSLQVLSNLKALGCAVIFSSFRASELNYSDRVILGKSPEQLLIDSHDHFLSTSEAYRALVMTEAIGKDWI